MTVKFRRFEEFMAPLAPVAIIGDDDIKDGFRDETGLLIAKGVYCVFKAHGYYGSYIAAREKDDLEFDFPDVKYVRAKTALEMFRKNSYNI